MAYIKQVSIDEATGATARLYQAAIQRAGSVANIILVMSRDGASANASMGLYVSVMKAINSLSGAQRDMLAAVVSMGGGGAGEVVSKVPLAGSFSNLAISRANSRPGRPTDTSAARQP